MCIALLGELVYNKHLTFLIYLFLTGQLFLAIISIIPATKNAFDEAVQNFAGCFCNKGILTSAVGPFILGCGMTVSGAVSLISYFLIYLEIMWSLNMHILYCCEFNTVYIPNLS